MLCILIGVAAGCMLVRSKESIKPCILTMHNQYCWSRDVWVSHKMPPRQWLVLCLRVTMGGVTRQGCRARGCRGLKFF